MQSASMPPAVGKRRSSTERGRRAKCARCSLVEEENAALKTKVVELTRANVKLQSKLKLREDQLFGKSTEKDPKPGEDDKKKSASDPEDPRPEILDEGSGSEDDKEREKKRKRGGQKGSKGHGRRSYDELPSQEIEHDLPEDEKHCPECDLPYEEFPDTEDSEQIEIDIRIHRRVHKRKRYRRVCDCAGQLTIVTAPGVAKLIPKGLLGTSMWVLVLLDKFLFQRPTYRLLAVLKAYGNGVEFSQATLTSGMKRLAPLFDPILEKIHLKNIEEDHWHADETRWLVFEEIDGKEGNRWWLWVFRSKSTVEFVLSPWRAAEVPEGHFGCDAAGTISADRYAVYKKLAKSGRFKIAFCWAHTRRDFVNLAKSYPQHAAWAQNWIDTIGGLYRVNASRREATTAKNAAGAAKAEKKLRSLVEVMVEIRDAELADGDLPEEKAKVLTRLLNHWEGLLIFLDSPWIPMDNNEAERLLRNPVVGRKNYYGSGAQWSGKFAATLFSVFQTLQIWGINPKLWLTSYLEACAACGGKPPSNVAGFLPWNMSEERRRTLGAVGAVDAS